MKTVSCKLKKFICVCAVFVSVFAVSVVPAHAFVEEETLFALSQYVFSLWWDTAIREAEKQAQLDIYKKYWTSGIPQSSSNYNTMSFDALSGICAELNTRGHQPCTIVLINGSYCIRSSGKYGLHSSSYVWNNNGYYLTDGQGRYIRASYYPDSLISSIKGDVSAIQNRVITTNTNLEAIDESLHASLNGTRYCVATLCVHIFNRLGTYGASLGTKLDDIYSLLDSVLRSYDSSGEHLYSIAAWSKNLYNHMDTLLTTTNSKLNEISTKIDGIDTSQPVTVLQQTQQYSGDVEDGLDYTSNILDLVRDFFSVTQSVDWVQAKNYATQWGSDTA